MVLRLLSIVRAQFTIPIPARFLSPHHTLLASVTLSIVLQLHMPLQLASADDSAVPHLTTWQSDMLRFGDLHCGYFKQGQGDTYYDAARVFYQIRDYTNDAKWETCAALAAVRYRDTQIGSGGAAPWNAFSTGLRMHVQRNGDAASRQAVHVLATTGFAADSTLTGGYVNPNYGELWDMAREIAYAIRSHLDDEALGAPHRARLDELVNHALKHYQQWFVTKQAITSPIPSPNGPVGLQPFMVGLCMQSLIAYYEKYADPRIPPVIRLATDELYKMAWRPTAGGFYYNSGLDTSAASAEPGLNLLIAPAYAWVYKQTGETIFRDRGDEIFGEGVRRANAHSVLGDQSSKGGYLWSGKQFNQQYMWSFDYLRWRKTSSNSSQMSPPRELRVQ